MKYSITTIITVCWFMLSFAQEPTLNELLLSDDSWAKEVIQMPIHFAPKIPYNGMEEIRFSPDWSKKDTAGFWSYAFVWDIDLNKELTANELETYLQHYFDGLMHVVNKDKDKIIPKTIALFIKKEQSKKSHEFVGKLQVYNAFHTKDVMILNCTVQQFYCPQKERSMVLFRFSPKEFEHTIWNQLNEIKLKDQHCN